MPPRGRGRGSSSRGGGGHKGQRRHFTNLEELEREKEKEERTRQWRAQRGEGDDDESGSGKGSGSSSSEDSSSDESGEEEGKKAAGEDQTKAKGVEHLIEVQNPNRVEKKPKKVAELDPEKDLAEAPQLSRREREELEKQRARQHYQKMHAAGKTEEARADLARLALIRKQREEQAKRKEEELKAKEAERKAKAESINKALGKKT